MCSFTSLTPPPFGRPAGVYPEENRVRNDLKQRQNQSFDRIGRAGEGAEILVFSQGMTFLSDRIAESYGIDLSQ